MFRSCIAALLLVFIASSANADLIFSITPAAQATPNDGVATFDLFFQSDSANTKIEGITALVLAGLGDGSGGVFVAGTVEIGDDPWFFDDPGQAFLAFNLASSYDTGPANTLNKLGSLTLDVSGINPGLNSISYDGEVLDAIDADTGFQIGASSTPSNYTVTAAVPEPSCIFLGIAVFGICLFRRRHHIS